MKYWIIYKKSDNDIYGYTNNKDIIDLFKLTRDMNNFYVKKFNLEKGDTDLELLHKEYAHSVMIIEDLETYDKDENKVTKIKMPLSLFEKNTIDQKVTMLHMSLQANSLEDPRLFNKEIRKALLTLSYHSMYLANTRIDYEQPNLMPDRFKIFLLLFEHTI